MYNNDSMIKDQAAGLRELSQSKPTKVIAVTAGKGGVGKTNVSINLAISLAKSGNKVLLLDADLGLANIDVILGVHTKYNLSHVLQGVCNISDIILEGPMGIKIIPASSGTEKMTQLSLVEHAGIINAFNEITESFDYMIIDTAAGISDTVLSFARSSQEIIVVVCDEPTSLTDAYALIKVMNRRYDWTHFRVLANMVRSIKDGKALFSKLYRVSEQFLDVTIDYMGAISFDENVHLAVKKQQPVMIAFPQSKAVQEMHLIAENVEKWPVSYRVGGNTSFFIERLVSQEN
jgi:flagellar biosynthesis protein FlhG